MPHTNAWDETAPAGGSALSAGDNAIRQMKLDIRERMAVYFKWNVSVAEDGQLKAGYQFLQTGMMAFWPVNSTPAGYLICDGAAVSRATYATLFAAVGIVYGAGDGSTTFNLPDMRGKTPYGKAAAGTGSTFGGSFGSLDHQHTGPSHTHTISSGGSHSHSVNSHTHSISTDGSHSHTVGMSTNNFQSDTTGGGLEWVSRDSHTHSLTAAGGHNHGGSTGAASPATDSQGNHDHGGATGAAGTGNTGTANPPGLVGHWIIAI